MGNPPDDKTTINVKAVPVKSWERAKLCAAKQGEAMGEWLSRAINQLADREAGPREFPANPKANLSLETGNPGQAVGLTAGELAGLMQGIAALAGASGTAPAKADMRQAYGLADDMVRDTRGLPRKLRRGGRAAGQSLPKNGKAARLIEGPARSAGALAEAEPIAEARLSAAEMKQIRRAAARPDSKPETATKD